MCFSLQADLVVGTAVSVVGVATLASAPPRREVALAALPLVLGTHLLVEATLWSGLAGGWWADHVGTATVVYLLVAFVVVPTLVPAAVALSEPEGERRRLLPFVGLGAVAAAWLGWVLAQGAPGAQISGHHIGYLLPHEPGGLVVSAYVVATCGPVVLSRRPGLRVFGWANLVAVVLLAVVQQAALISLWCAWATLTSVLVHQHVRRRAVVVAGSTSPVAPLGTAR